jgi:hypothetical protein
LGNQNQQGAVNTDKVIWEKTPGDAYTPRIEVTKEGNIKICIGGSVWEKPIDAWAELACRNNPFIFGSVNEPPAEEEYIRMPRVKFDQLLKDLTDIIKMQSEVIIREVTNHA